MIFNLMYKDKKIAEIHIETDVSLFAFGINKVFTPSLMPKCFTDTPTSHQLWKWWQARYPDRDRDGLTDMIGYYTNNQIAVYDYSFIHLSLLSYGVSLMDKYWLNPVKPYSSKDFLMHAFPENSIIEPTTYSFIQTLYSLRWNTALINTIRAFALDTKHPSIIPPIILQHPQFAVYGNKAKYYQWDDNTLYCYKLYPNKYNAIRHQVENELPLRKQMSEWINNNGITKWTTEEQVDEWTMRSKFFLKDDEEYYDFVMFCLDKQLDGYDDENVKRFLIGCEIPKEEINEWMDEKNRLKDRFGISDYIFLDNLGIVYNNTTGQKKLLSRL